MTGPNTGQQTGQTMPPTGAENPLKEEVYYTPAHLDRIRELYVSGSPISLPAQLEEERTDLDAKRATFTNTQAVQGSTGAGTSATLRPSTASAPSAPGSTPGTAGSSTGATT